MMKASRNELAATIRKEFKEGRNWCRQDWGRYYKMMIDVSDASIWSDIFLDKNDWKEYKSDSIMQLEAIPDTVAEMEKEYLTDAISKLERVGWEITE